jgi:hypothetical protein
VASTRDDEIEAARVGELGPTRADGPIHLAEYDPPWPGLFEREAARIRSILGDRVLLLEHVGSTSIPRPGGKAAHRHRAGSPDSADEAAYVSAAGRRRLRPQDP